MKKTNEYIIKYGEKSVDLEIGRENNISKRCNAILTTISILVVPFITVFLYLLENLNKSRILIIIFGVILLLILITSLVFAIQSQWFYKKNYLQSSEEFENHVNNYNKYTQDDFDRQLINDYNEIYKSLSKSNDKRTRWAICSIISLYTFFAVLLAFFIVILFLI